MAKQDLQDISDALDVANGKIDKVSADVASLHAQIDGVDTPTQAEWDAVKAKVSAMNDKLQTVDDQTPDATTAP